MQGGARPRHMGADLPARSLRKDLPMSDALKLGFAPFAAPAKGVLIVFCDDGLKFGPATRKALAPAGDLVARAATAERFTGKSGSRARNRRAGRPEGRPAGGDRRRQGRPSSSRRISSSSAALAMGKLPVARRARRRSSPNLPGGALKPEQAADLALGVRLRAYAFDRYKTKRKDGEEPPAKRKRHDRGRRRRRRAQGLRGARGGRRRRADGARSGQRAGQRALSGGIRPPRGGAEESSASRSRCST